MQASRRRLSSLDPYAPPTRSPFLSLQHQRTIVTTVWSLIGLAPAVLVTVIAIVAAGVVGASVIVMDSVRPSADGLSAPIVMTVVSLNATSVTSVRFAPETTK